MPIKSKDLVAQAKKQNAANLAAAFKSGDEDQMSAAMAAFCTDVHDAVLAQAAEDIELRNQDSAIMASRGLHALTSAEMNYYTKLGEALKSSDPKMALNNFSVAMPETIIDGVIGTIRKDHPLLYRINFQNTAYLTRMILSNNPAQMAKWGKITDAVTKELTGSLKEVNLTMLKLTAFMCISQDLIDLGPQWIDQYVRETLAEAIASALETGIVDGNGKDEPIGMTRDISSSASVQDGVYPRQTPVVLTELTPTAMGEIVSKIARDPNDPTKARVVASGDLIFLCNPFDYWKKIMPATSFRKPDGSWMHDVLPVPADTMQTAALEEGRAVLGMPSKYFVGLGVYGKTGTIVPDDSVRFFEDERAYKAKLQGNARPMDEYAFVLLDISNLKTELPILTKAVTDAA
ncbi:MAG: phage major capsid protein [Faecousia sp.]